MRSLAARAARSTQERTWTKRRGLDVGIEFFAAFLRTRSLDAPSKARAPPRHRNGARKKLKTPRIRLTRRAWCESTFSTRPHCRDVDDRERKNSYSLRRRGDHHPGCPPSPPENCDVGASSPADPRTTRVPKPVALRGVAMTPRASYGVSVTQRSWTEVCLVLLAFALVLGVIGLAAFDGQNDAQAKSTDAVTVLAEPANTPP